MSSFAKQYLDKTFQFTPEIVSLIAAISVYKGKQGLFEQQSPEILKKLQEVATIQSTESSNRIEGIVIKNPRLKELMAEKTTPRDRSENEVAAYRKVLSLIHSNTKDIPVRSNIIKQLHKELYAFSPGEGGSWKSSDNSITETHPDGTKVVRFQPTPAHLTDIAMGDLCSNFLDEFERKKHNDLIVIGAFILDFLCIHPFRDGNGRMARLLTLLCLYHSDYSVGRFISLEKIIEDTKDSYYSSLYISSQEWHQGRHNVVPWIEYFLGTILKAYREFESRVGTVKTARGQKNERVREFVLNSILPFHVSEIVEKCPDIARPTINGVLRTMKEEGLIEKIGSGPTAKWRRV